jgi:hypothetical protein
VCTRQQAEASSHPTPGELLSALLQAVTGTKPSHSSKPYAYVFALIKLNFSASEPKKQLCHVVPTGNVLCVSKTTWLCTQTIPHSSESIIDTSRTCWSLHSLHSFSCVPVDTTTCQQLSGMDDAMFHMHDTRSLSNQLCSCTCHAHGCD